MTILRAAYPRQTITSKQYDKMVVVWADILEDLPFELVKAAMREWCSRDEPWFPSVGQIRTIALDLTASEADRMTAGEAWDEVCRAFRNHGHWRAFDWTHPNIGRAVKAMGGWAYLCNSENPMADRARFMDSFKALQQRTEHDRRMLPSVRDYVDQHRQLEVEKQMKRLTTVLTGDNGR